MVNGKYWLAHTEQQVRIMTDARFSADLLEQTEREAAKFPGWQFWKKYPNGREYLVHAFDRTGRGTTLGARAEETERLHDAFQQGKAAAKLRLRAAEERVAVHARFVKAAKLNRFPLQAAKVVHAFNDAGFSDEFTVVGTHSLYAYEAMADVTFVPEAMETEDFDYLWDPAARHKIEAVLPKSNAASESAIDILKKVDSTYTRNTERTFQAINAGGFQVEFLRPTAPAEPPLFAPNDELNPMSLPGLEWLIAGRRVETVFDKSGNPLKIAVADPRVFAGHKAWLSERPDRRAGKRDRDRMQSQVVRELLETRLRDFTLTHPLPEYDWGALRPYLMASTE